MNIKYNKLYRKCVALINKAFPVVIAKMRFRKMFGRRLNLKNPEDLNEKILWLSLLTDTSQWSRLADKYIVRDYVKEKGLESILVKLYGKWDSVESIDWQKLPQSFILKSNNGSGTVKIVNDKDALSHPEIDNLLNSWLHMHSGTTTSERHYARIQPCIIAEELLHQSNEEKRFSSSIVDYKIWCFNGIPSYIWTVSNRNDTGFDGALFDIQWNNIPNILRNNPNVRQPLELLPKPKNLDYMLQVAHVLSVGFPEVRVDLYNIDGQVYFGELTFTTHGGTIDYFVPELLLEMGSKIDLSDAKIVHRIW